MSRTQPNKSILDDVLNLECKTTKIIDSEGFVIPPNKKPLYLRTSAPLIQPEDANFSLEKVLQNSNLLTWKHLANRIHYIADPGICSLECSISLAQDCLKSKIIFQHIADEISAFIGGIPFDKDEKTFSLRFKDVAALKFLKQVFKGQNDHALYCLYAKWIIGGEWMNSF